MPLMAVTNGAESSHSKEAMNLKIPKDKTLAIVMGGGAGTRLFPLTEKRAKPAVPLGANTAWWTSRSATALTAVFGRSTF